MGSFSLIHWIIFAAICYVLWRAFRPKQKGPTNTPPAPDRRQRPAVSEQPQGESKPDHWEGAFWDVENPRPSDIDVNLFYKDGAGNRTKRTVHVTGFDADPQGILIGHCMLRDERRTFRYDRVERAVDPQTGEIIGDLHGWLMQKYLSSPKGMAAELTNNHLDLIKVLLYMAKADGTLRTAEIAEIATAAADITGDKNITPDVASTALKMLDTPTLHGFKLAFGRIRKADQEVATKVARAAHRIVETQKTIHPAEQAALDYIDQALASPPSKR